MKNLLIAVLILSGCFRVQSQKDLSLKAKFRERQREINC